MSGTTAVIPRYQFSRDGVPLVNGTVETYLAGTTTPTETWTDKALTSSNGTAITLDANGECTIRLRDDLNYKFVLKNALGVTQWTEDNISGIVASAAALSYGSGTVADQLDALSLASYTALRAYTGPSKFVNVTGYMALTAPSPTAGLFTRDDADTTSADNGGTIIVSSDDTRWKRVFDGSIQAKWFGVTGDGVTDDTAAIQSVIDYVESLNGGDVVFAAGDFRITAQLNVNVDNVRLVGQGQGGIASAIAATRTSSATRLFWDAAASSTSAMVEFKSPGGERAKNGGGIARMMLDCVNLCGVGLRLVSWSRAHFEDITVYASTADGIHLTTSTVALSFEPDSSYDNVFINFTTTYTNAATNNSNGVRLSRGENAPGTGNSCYNRFYNCRFQKGETGGGKGIVLENSDNNMFFGCNSPDVRFCSNDEAPLQSTGSARFNSLYGFEGDVIAEAGQTGNSSSHDNYVSGLNTSNGKGAVTVEAGAGGSDNASVYVDWADGRKRLPRTTVLGTATVTSQELDYYMEGVWTPTVLGGTTAGTVTYGAQSGSYQRIGDRCHFSGFVNYSSLTGTGDLRIAGLPFASRAGSVDASISIRATSLTFTGQLAASVIAGESYITLQQISTGVAMTNVQVDAAAILHFSGFYPI